MRKRNRNPFHHSPHKPVPVRRPEQAMYTPAQRAQLEALDALCGRLGRTPMREELPPCLRMGLAASFGTLRNAFFQLGRVPLSAQEVRTLRHGSPSGH